MINTLLNTLHQYARRLNTALGSDVAFTLSVGFLCGFWTTLLFERSLLTAPALLGWWVIFALAYATLVACCALLHTLYRRLAPHVRRFWYAWQLSRDEVLFAEDDSEREDAAEAQRPLEVVGGHTREETCYLTVHDARGHVQTLAPGEPGYEEAACVVMTLYPHLTSLFGTPDDESAVHPDEEQDNDTPEEVNS